MPIEQDQDIIVEENDNLEVKQPESAAEPEVQKSTRLAHQTPRAWYVKEQKTGLILEENLESRAACMETIRDFGATDTPYIIGYSVNDLDPITKTTQIKIK